MNKQWFLALGLVLSEGSSSVAQGRASKVDDAIWVADELYGTVLTPTVFESPPPQSTDPIYSFMESGLDGQRSIAEAAPGDPSYSGGRWDVYLVFFTDQGLERFDADDDGTVDFELTNADDLFTHEEAGDLEIVRADFFFECPLLP